MQAYETALEDEGTTMVLSPDNAFFKFLNDPNGVLEASKTGPVKRGSRVDVDKIISNGSSLSMALCPEIVADAAPAE
jgi:hypothetical protein